MAHPHYELVENAIRILSSHPNPQQSTSLLVQQLGISPQHLQRTFRQWAGIPPKQVIHALSREHTLEIIKRSQNIFQASQDAGFSGPGRLHDYTIKLEAATPGQIKSRGEGLTILWDTGQSPFGLVFCAHTPLGVCALHFLNANFTRDQALSELQLTWPKANIKQDPHQGQGLLSQIFHPDKSTHLNLWVKASPFQIKVWQALIAIPPGYLTTYKDLANWSGVPGAARSVGTAVGSNSIAWLIPCHRVIRQTGQFGQYKWEENRKQAIHAWETAKFSI